MKQQLLETWAIHHSKNGLLLDAITDAGMQKTLSTRGGRSIFLQWVHLHNVRLQWLEICAKDLFKKFQVLDKDAPFNRKLLRSSLDDSAKGLSELFSQGWDNGGKVKGFKKGVFPLVGYFISHESHHRGNMLLTLKQSGEKIPDTVKWGIWDWTK